MNEKAKKYIKDNTLDLSERDVEKAIKILNS